MKTFALVAALATAAAAGDSVAPEVAIPVVDTISTGDITADVNQIIDSASEGVETTEVTDAVNAVVASGELELSEGEIKAN